MFGAGHLHPGGLSVDLEVSRDGPDAGSTAGGPTDPVQPLFHSDAKYYEPAGAVSWDVSMKATRPEWRVSLKEGDLVSIDSTYDVEKASWYESMGILPLASLPRTIPLRRTRSTTRPPSRRCTTRAASSRTGAFRRTSTPRPATTSASPDPRKLKSKGKVKKDEAIEIDGFRYLTGGYSAFENFPQSYQRPPLVKPGFGVNFTNTEATLGQPDNRTGLAQHHVVQGSL